MFVSGIGFAEVRKWNVDVKLDSKLTAVGPKAGVRGADSVSRQVETEYRQLRSFDTVV